MKTKSILLALAFLSAFVSATNDANFSALANATGTVVGSFAGSQTCVPSFYTGSLCGFFLIGFAWVVILNAVLFGMGIAGDGIVAINFANLMILNGSGVFPPVAWFLALLLAGALLAKAVFRLFSG